MREIKFRAWDNVENQMYYTGEEELILFMFNSFKIVADKIIPDDSEQGYHVEKLEHLQYMQFTGLKDKNSVEIYEGDIVLLLVDNKRNRVIEYKNEEACFVARCLVGTEYHEVVYLNDMDFEVIGNIYEHPELLGESK